MPIKPLSPVDNGLTFDFPAALLALAEAAEELPLEVELAAAVPEVMLPFGTFEGMPEATPTAPTVGSATLGSNVHPLAPAVADGQDGGVIEEAEAAYADEATPLGDKVAHCAWRLEKSGDTGVGVPWRVYPSMTLVPSMTVAPANGP